MQTTKSHHLTHTRGWGNRFVNLFTFFLPILFMSCNQAAMAATVKILQTTNISSKVAAVCSGVRKVYVTDVSTDGSVAVGKCAKKDDLGEWQVFLYSQSGGFKNLGTMGKKSIDNIHISADGLVIYGTFYVENEGSHIFRYTQTEGLQDLGTMGKEGISVNAVSADGSVIVGHFHDSQTEYPMLYHAFRYSRSQGFEDLGAMSTESTIAQGVSADGSLIVGHFEIGSSSKNSVRQISSHAFQYSHPEGMKDIGVAGWGESAFATGISNDGSVIVGQGVFRIGFIVSFYEDSFAFVYTEKGGMQKLSQIGGESVGSPRISADGTRVAGSYRESNGDVYVYTGKVILP